MTTIVKLRYDLVAKYIQDTFPFTRFPNLLTRCPIELYDEYYYVTPYDLVIPTLEKIHAFFETSKLVWKKDVWDCDNFAGLFKQLFTLYTKTNSVFQADGRVDSYLIENDTIFPFPEILGYHAFNVLFFSAPPSKEVEIPSILLTTIENQAVYLSVLEPQFLLRIMERKEYVEAFLKPYDFMRFKMFGYEVLFKEDEKTRKYLIVYHPMKVHG